MSSGSGNSLAARMDSRTAVEFIDVRKAWSVAEKSAPRPWKSGAALTSTSLRSMNSFGRLAMTNRMTRCTVLATPLIVVKTMIRYSDVSTSAH